jgi:hypothetical protein
LKEKLKNFYYSLDSLYHRFSYPFRRVYYRLRLFKKFWKHYFASWDICDSFLGINMELFCDFYEHGGMDEVVWEDDWGIRDNIKLQMDEIYNWWKVERAKRLEEIDIVLDEWSQHHFHFFKKDEKEKFFKWISINTKYSEYLFNLLNDLENALEKDSERYLVYLMEMRNYLWT